MGHCNTVSFHFSHDFADKVVVYPMHFSYCTKRISVLKQDTSMVLSAATLLGLILPFVIIRHQNHTVACVCH